MLKVYVPLPQFLWGSGDGGEGRVHVGRVVRIDVTVSRVEIEKQ